MVRLFLHDLEQSRKCGAATRNQRLAAIHSLARYIGLHSPEHVVWFGQLRAIPPKRAPRSCITYLEKTEMDALLNAPDKSTEQGRRDYVLLLFLYNTGARADEAAQACQRPPLLDSLCLCLAPELPLFDLAPPIPPPSSKPGAMSQVQCLAWAMCGTNRAQPRNSYKPLPKSVHIGGITLGYFRFYELRDHFLCC
jgi:hypothetical protein